MTERHASFRKAAGACSDRDEGGAGGASSPRLEEGDVIVDAAVIASGFGLEPATVPALLRSGDITARCERGLDEDAGRHRLTFFFGNRRLRLVLDGQGHVITRGLIDFGDRPLPGSLRRVGD